MDNLEIMEDAKNYNNFLANQIILHSKKQKNILDFGAGTGTFAKILAQKGIQVSCVENDEKLYNQLTSKAFKTYKDLKEVPSERYGHIYSLNVLEHIKDDFAQLQKIRQNLKPHGSFYLFVPAFQVLYTSMDKKVGHLRRYKKSSLIDLVTRAGFKVKRCRYVDSVGFIVTLVFKFIGNNRGDLNPLIIKIYDRFIFPISRVFDKIFGKFFGKNLEIVLYKE